MVTNPNQLIFAKNNLSIYTDNHNRKKMNNWQNKKEKNQKPKKRDGVKKKRNKHWPTKIKAKDDASFWFSIVFCVPTALLSFYLC